MTPPSLLRLRGIRAPYAAQTTLEGGRHVPGVRAAREEPDQVAYGQVSEKVRYRPL
jgi:hypothetical protein